MSNVITTETQAKADELQAQFEELEYLLGVDPSRPSNSSVSRGTASLIHEAEELQMEVDSQLEALAHISLYSDPQGYLVLFEDAVMGLKRLEKILA